MGDGFEKDMAGRLLSAADVKRIDAAAGAVDPQAGLAALMARAGAAVAGLAEKRFGARKGAASPGPTSSAPAFRAMRAREGEPPSRQACD